jgi:CheY-like chemotaxis protein
MKKLVLLVDESLTVQKVVALTLDRNRFHVAYAKSRAEVLRQFSENVPDVVLVSDQVPDITAATFPREVETWLARRAPTPPFVLITAQEGVDARQYAATLKKPFSPQRLLQTVTDLLPKAPPTVATPVAPPRGVEAATEDLGEQRLARIFNDAFSDEARLVRETFEGPAPARPEPTARPAAPPPPTVDLRPSATEKVLGAGDSLAYKAALESRVAQALSGDVLDAVVERVLNRILPPIVERIVEERLDRLLKEQEHFLDLKQ